MYKYVYKFINIVFYLFIYMYKIFLFIPDCGSFDGRKLEKDLRARTKKKIVIRIEN